MTARPRIESPTARASMALVAARSIPGSIEARLVHGCTCAPNRGCIGCQRDWKPDQVEHWQSLICLGCPAHGRLLERYVMRLRSPDDSGVRRHPAAVPQQETQRRPLWARVGLVVRAWLAGW